VPAVSARDGTGIALDSPGVFLRGAGRTSG